jgi:mannitol-1-phosphate/altronate dehydrogenase
MESDSSKSMGPTGNPLNLCRSCDLKRFIVKLCNKNIPELKKMGIDVPEYDRSKLEPHIVHIGLGHFHRSHFLTYLDTLIRKGQETSGAFEVDVVPSNEGFIRNLRDQDYLYSVLSLGADGSKKLRVNGPIIGYANQATDSDKVESVLSSDDTRLITLTITEKGYLYLDETNSLDWNNPAIIHDLESDEAPKTAVGVLSLSLKKRFKNDRPVTIMSCDNVPENSVMLRNCILMFCRKKYPEIVSWVEKKIAFPCTMVDRITPGTTDKDIKALQVEYGLEDFCPVHCEDFLQWVVEKKSCTAVPDFSKAGALMVDDVKCYELMKIRLLNGSHSALSYPAYMMGITAVHDAVNTDVIRDFIRNHYMEEITTTLAPVPGMDLNGYKDKLISRFSNINIADTILRLASDGSKKISNAIIRPLEETIDRKKDMNAIILTLAMWEYFFIFKDDEGRDMPIDDPKAEELSKVCDNPEAFLVAAGLNENYRGEKWLFNEMESDLAALKCKGVRRCLEEFCENGH